VAAEEPCSGGERMDSGNHSQYHVDHVQLGAPLTSAEYLLENAATVTELSRVAVMFVLRRLQEKSCGGAARRCTGGALLRGSKT
jgi:hypothetical protein